MNIPPVFFLIASAIDNNQWFLVKDLVDSVEQDVFDSFRTEFDQGLTNGSIAYVTVARYNKSKAVSSVCMVFC